MVEENKQQAVEWLKHYLRPRHEEGRQTFCCSAQAIWERTGRPRNTFRRWWTETKKRNQLQEGADFRRFRAKNGAKPQEVSNGPTYPSSDYLLTADAAKLVMMRDDSEAGLELRWALVDLLNRIAAGDAELIDYALQRVREPEQAERHLETAYECLTEMYRRRGKSPENCNSHAASVRSMRS